jgi:hypothetical protein
LQDARERVEERAGALLPPGWGVEPVEEGAVLSEGEQGLPGAGSITDTLNELAAKWCTKETVAPVNAEGCCSVADGPR